MTKCPGDNNHHVIEYQAWIHIISATEFKLYTGKHVKMLSVRRRCSMSYKHLSYEHRCLIYALKKSGLNQSQIAKEIGVHRSTVTRALKRNITKLGAWRYKPEYAHTYAVERKKYQPKLIKMAAGVTSMVNQGWSPEQISGYAKKRKIF